MKQVKWWNFFWISPKKGRIYNKIYKNLQSTVRWPKSLVPVFITRVPLPRIHRVVAVTLPTSRHGLGQVQLPRQTSGAQQQPSLFFALVCVPWPLPCVGGGAERPRQQRTKKWATLVGFEC